MDLVIILAVLAAIVWVLMQRGGTIPRSTGLTIFWILVVGAAVALLLHLVGGGPPDRVPPG
ncbi:MAG: hypothetical protein WEA29_08380 [Acidimicrobiia bacterium]